MKSAFFGLVLGVYLLYLVYNYIKKIEIHNLEYVIVIIFTLMVCTEDVIKEIKKLKQ